MNASDLRRPALVFQAFCWDLYRTAPDRVRVEVHCHPRFLPALALKMRTQGIAAKVASEHQIRISQAQSVMLFLVRYVDATYNMDIRQLAYEYGRLWALRRSGTAPPPDLPAQIARVVDLLLDKRRLPVGAAVKDAT